MEPESFTILLNFQGVIPIVSYELCRPSDLGVTHANPSQTRMRKSEVVSLQLVAQYKRPAWRPSPGQKDADHRAIMASQRPSVC